METFPVLRIEMKRLWSTKVEINGLMYRAIGTAPVFIDCPKRHITESEKHVTNFE